MYLANIADFPS